MGIYYFAVDHNRKQQMWPPKGFSFKYPFGPTNPFPHMVMMENFYGKDFELISDIYSTYEHEYEDVTEEMYIKLKMLFPNFNWDEGEFQKENKQESDK